MKKRKSYTLFFWFILLGMLTTQSSCQPQSELLSGENITLEPPINNKLQDDNESLILDSFLPELSEIKITKFNAYKVVELARFGRGSIEQISVSPDGTTLAVASSIGVWLYDTDTLHPVKFLQSGGDWLRSVAWSPDGDWLVFGGLEGIIYVYNIITEEKILFTQGDGGKLMIVTWSPNGAYLATGDNRGKVKIWEALTGKLLQSFEGDSSGVRYLDWSPDSSLLAFSRWEAKVHIWDVEAETIIIWDDINSFGGHNVSWSPDGKQLVFVDRDGRIYIWDIEENQLIQTLDGHSRNIRNVVWSPDGTKLASTGFADDTVRVWEAESGNQLLLWERQANPDLDISWSPEDDPQSTWLGNVVWTPDGETLIFNVLDGTVYFWDIAGNGALRVLAKHWEWVTSVVWSPDGSQLAYGSGYGSIFIIDPTSGELLRMLEGHHEWVKDIAWSPDGNWLASVSDDRSAQVWDVARGEVRFELVHDDDINLNKGIAWSPDGTKVATQGKIWDAATGQLIHEFGGRLFGWSPDGTLIAIYRRYELHFLDTTHWEEVPISLTSLTPMGTPIAFDWSSDSDKFALGDAYGRVKVFQNYWECLSWNLQGHTGAITDLAWSPDATMLASVDMGENGRAILYNAHGKALKKIQGHSLGVLNLSWSPDGSMLVTAGYDGTLRIWGIPAD